MIQFQLDPAQLEEMVISATEKILAKQQEQAPVSGLPLTLSKKQVEEQLGLGATKVQELFKRKDFPVIWELGHPKVVTHLLIKWLESHSEWVEENQTTRRRLG